MSIQQNFPAIAPSLSLNFARSKTLDPRITFTRTSSATRVNGQGLIEVVPANTPRFDHSYDPVSGTVKSLGLLIEEQRSNLWFASEAPDTVFYQPELVSFSPNSTIAPDGNQTADKIIPPNGVPSASITQGTTIPSGATMTGSVFVKYSDLDRVEIVILSNNNTTPYARATMNPQTGEITIPVATANGGTNASSSIVAYPNGWYRFSVTVTYPAVTLGGMRVWTGDSGGSLGDGIKGTFVWGMQFEQGAFPTSYIPTTAASTATRTPDNTKMEGSNFSSWYNPNEGTIFADSLVKYNPNATRFVWGLSGGSIEHSLRQPHLTGLKFRAVIGGTFTPSPGTGNNSVDGTTTKAAVAYNSTTGRLQVGTSSDEVTVSGIVYATEFTIGPHNGTIKNITYYPRRLTNTQLQTLTR